MDLVSDLKGKEIKWVCLNEFVDYIVLGCGVFIEVVYLKIIEMVSKIYECYKNVYLLLWCVRSCLLVSLW